ncbi:MAG: phosphate ABC transporter permease subunit PstC [Coriobacteriia bacterium]|nr:phosphate ABC transporter permease subunit PstC [Coriobacteriia bacterium]
MSSSQEAAIRLRFSRADGSLGRLGTEKLVERALAFSAASSGAAILFVIAFVFMKAYPLLARDGLAWLARADWDGAVMEAWWNPDFWRFGALPLLVGTFATTTGALMVAVPLGVGCAIILSEVAPPGLGRILATAVRLLSGVPSVIFGLVGLTVVVPFVQKTFITEELGLRYVDVPLDGQSLLAGSLVLAFMIIPFVVAVSADAMRSVPESYRFGGLALGMTKWRTIAKLVIPPALPGIVAGIVLATARGIGEAIAMAMVAGGLANIPHLDRGFVAFLEPVRTLASAIVENGEGMSVLQVESALFSLGATLLVVSVVTSILARAAFSRLRTKTGLATERAI